MDKNQVIGLVLISLLLIVYIVYFSPETTSQTSRDKSSLMDTTQSITQLSNKDQLQKVSKKKILKEEHRFLSQAIHGKSQKIHLENEDIKIVFNTKGGKVEEVTLKNYVTNQKKKLVLLDKKSSQITESIQLKGDTFNLDQLYYQSYQPDEHTLVFRAGDTSQFVQKTYSLASKGFLLAYHMSFENMNLSKKEIIISWRDKIRKLEKSLKQSRYQAAINFYTESEDFDYIKGHTTTKEQKIINEPIQWFSFKQKFFNMALITNHRFENTLLTTYADESDTNTVAILSATFSIPIIKKHQTDTLNFYFGPNDYNICKEISEQIASDFEKNVYLGWAIFAPINRIAIIPLFQLLEKYITNYGIIILLMVILVKILLFPLTFKSYLSMAKMKVLKPEIEEIKAKHGNDMQKVQQENMRLYGKFGVNPFSGCIPMLAQMPVLLAMFNFFPNAIQLRQKGFLWADDLSSYDSILDLSFDIPFYGNHVSLFTLLMTASTIVYTYYNNQMGASSAAAAQGPMKVMMYIMPVMVMFFLNDYSSGLTYYYFISNIITILQQIIARNFIDEEKIRNKLDENKKRNKEGGKSGSRFIQRLNEAMKAQEKFKNKNNTQREKNQPHPSQKRRNKRKK